MMIVKRCVCVVAVRPWLTYPDEAYIAAVQAEFPDKGVATAEEGRCLWDAGYDVLDVRALAEIDSNANTPCPNPAAPGKADATHPKQKSVTVGSSPTYKRPPNSANRPRGAAAEDAS
jgi:hypothetical protein